MSEKLNKMPRSNAERLARNRGCYVTMIWNIDHHKYRDASGVHYIPYNIGSNEAKRKRRAQNSSCKHHNLYRKLGY